MKTFSLKFCALIIGALAVLSFNSRNVAAQSNGEPYKEPEGKWSFRFGAYRGPGYETAPVRVVGLSGRVAKNKDIVWVRFSSIENRTDKTVKQLSFAFFIYKNDDLDVQSQSVMA